MIILSIICFLLTSALICSLYYSYRLSLIVLRVEDNVEDCLDSLDEAYSKISKIANTPTISDDPFVREVVRNVDASRKAVEKVASTLVHDWTQKE